MSKSAIRAGFKIWQFANGRDCSATHCLTSEIGRNVPESDTALQAIGESGVEVFYNRPLPPVEGAEAGQGWFTVRDGNIVRESFAALGQDTPCYFITITHKEIRGWNHSRFGDAKLPYWDNTPRPRQVRKIRSDKGKKH